MRVARVDQDVIIKLRFHLSLTLSKDVGEHVILGLFLFFFSRRMMALLIEGLLHPILSHLLNKVDDLLGLGKSFQALQGDLVEFITCWHLKKWQSNLISLDILAQYVRCDGHGSIYINAKELTSET